MTQVTQLLALPLLLLSLSLAFGCEAKTEKKPPPRVESTIPAGSGDRAVSLKVLQKKVKECRSLLKCPPEVRHLAGITSINGYVLDNANHDVILFGEVDSSLPPLNLEDFVIALRNAWMKYAERKGNTIYYSHPGCSIDPDPKVMARLQEIAKQALGGSSPDSVEKGIGQWREVCGNPQEVRVLGIPFDSRFAWAMVKADYDMKRLVDGSDSLAIPEFSSLTDMTLDRIKEDMSQGRSSSIPLAAMNRFWFYPGENRYLEDEGVVEIDQCPVVLLTEAEYLNQRGQITGSGEGSPLAVEFTRSFSARYADIARERPIYKDLENLYRLVALAKIMKFKDVFQKAGLDVDVLLKDCTLPETPVQRELPGLCNVKKFEQRRDLKNGYEIAQLWLPSCGGVGIDIGVSDTTFAMDGSRKLSALRILVIGARPAVEALYWDYPLEKRALKGERAGG